MKGLAVSLFAVGVGCVLGALLIAISEVRRLAIDDAPGQGLDTSFLTKTGEPFRHGRVYIYEAGSTRMAVSYRTPELRDDFGLVNANPVQLDARGRANIYLRPGAYDVVLDGVTVRVSAPAGP